MEYTNFKGQKYYLHGKMVNLRGGNRQQQIHWFAKEMDMTTLIDELPEGFEVVENKRTGLPVLRRIK